MLELGLIHSQSLAGSGIPIVMWSLTCTQRGFAWGEQDEAGGGERLEGDTPPCLLMAELDATLKITAGSGFFSFSARGHDDRLSVCWERITKHFLNPYITVFAPKHTEYPSFKYWITKISWSFFDRAPTWSDSAASFWWSWARADDTPVLIIHDGAAGLKRGTVWQACVDTSRIVAGFAGKHLLPFLRCAPRMPIGTFLFFFHV